MAKLIINIGLPASGKSTESEKKILAEGNTVRINKDLLRTMLHFDKFNHRNEGHTRDAARTLVAYFLEQGVNVIIDDTNLNPSTKQSWKDLAAQQGAKIEYQDLTWVSVEDCIARDAVREKKVGAHVIQKMALQHLDYKKGEATVVCDLDGTLCDIEHRLHFAKSNPKDWKSFFAGIPSDVLRLEVASQVAMALEANHAQLIFVSARPENYRTETEAWLARHGYDGVPLIMREAGDKREDTLVKKEIFDKYLKGLNIVKVFDDRPSVIRMWQEQGLDVVDVGSGVEF